MDIPKLRANAQGCKIDDGIDIKKAKNWYSHNIADIYGPKIEGKFDINKPDLIYILINLFKK